MLLRFDPFRDVDRLFDSVVTGARAPRMVPMDAYRRGDAYYVEFDLPGVDPSSVDLTVERNALTIRAERVGIHPEDAQVVVAERPTGTFSRQLVLGDGLDTEQVSASYDNGVLRVVIPVAQQAKPRRISVDAAGSGAESISGGQQREPVGAGA